MEVVVQSLSPGTTNAQYALEPDDIGMASGPWIGGDATITLPGEAEFTIPGVPEGRSLLEVVGYSGVSGHWCTTDYAAEWIQVVPTSRRTYRIEATPFPLSGCDAPEVRAGAIRASPHYDFDPNHVYAGSQDGQNVIELKATGWDPDVDLAVFEDFFSPRFGFFTALPDPEEGEVWPDPSAWGLGTAVRTDADGNAVVYAVATPGAPPGIRLLSVCPAMGGGGFNCAGPLRAVLIRLLNVTDVNVRVPPTPPPAAISSP